MSYDEAIMNHLIFDDDEPVYDRLPERDGVRHTHTSQARKRVDSQNCQRVRGTHVKPNRESVLNLADDLMERNFATQSQTYGLTPTEHVVSEVSISPSVRFSNSTKLPEHKSHVATPLAPHHRRTSSNDLKVDGKKRPFIEVTSPLTPKGTVSKMTKKFSYPMALAASSPTTGMKGAKNPVGKQGNSPLKAMTSAVEMMKSSPPVKISGSNKVPLRSSDRKRGNKERPASFDLSLLLKNKKNMEQYHGNSTSSSNNSNNNIQGDSDSDINVHRRNGNERRDSRRRSRSREQSPDSAPEDLLPFRSPTTGVLISGPEKDAFVPGKIPEFNEMNALALALEEEEMKLSQNNSSQSSQESIRNLNLTVRERTQRWEARGGGVPSYFSTLPKSFRHKATDVRKDPAYLQYMSMEEYPEEALEEQEEAMMMMLSAGNTPLVARDGKKFHHNSRTSTSSNGSQPSTIVPKASNFDSPPSSLRNSSHVVPNSGVRLGSGSGIDQDYSLSPERHRSHLHHDYHLGMYSSDDGGRSLNSSGQSRSSNENSLERRLKDGLEGVSPPRRSSSLSVSRYSATQVRRDTHVHGVMHTHAWRDAHVHGRLHTTFPSYSSKIGFSQW